jgi:type IV pilus secretin PilQ/predicted competence protein
MERSIRWAWLAFLAAITMIALPPAWGAKPAAPAAAAETVNAGYLENVAFERLPGRERVILTVSKQSGVTVESPQGNAVLVRLENLFVPEALRRPLGDAALVNILRVTPAQKTAEGRSWVIATIDLKQRVPYSVRQEGMNVLIDFNVTSVTTALPAPEKPLPIVQMPAGQPAEKPAAQTGMAAKGVAGDAGQERKVQSGARISLDVQDADIKAVFRLLSELGKVSIASGDDVKGPVTLLMRDVPWEQALDTILGIKGLSKIEKDNVIMVMTNDNFLKLKKAEDDSAKRTEEERARRQRNQLYTEPLITRIVPIKYRLLQSIKKIDMKRDVLITGAVKEATAGAGNLKSLPSGGPELSADGGGQQKKDANAAGSAGETTTQKVSMEGAGDFIQLLQSFLSTDADGKQRGWIGADPETNSIIITASRGDLVKIMDMIAKIDIPTNQILIKANIVETTKSTARNLGIQWGGVYGRKFLEQNLYVTPGGTGGSTTPPGSVLDGTYKPASGITGIGGQGYGVNFPASSILGVGPASLGLLFGTIGGNILDVQLSALQNDGKLNILSSPSLATLDNQMASTENGEDVPVVTPATATSPATVTWKRAVLRLEITPHVIDGKNIKMTIVVKKDEADFTRQVQGNPPIFVKETKTDLVVADGETIVISGLTKQKKDSSTSGVPWLKEIPALGWLFKGEGKNESMEEVLIFITPNIMRQQEMAGIQTGF